MTNNNLTIFGDNFKGVDALVIATNQINGICEITDTVVFIYIPQYNVDDRFLNFLNNNDEIRMSAGKYSMLLEYGMIIDSVKLDDLYCYNGMNLGYKAEDYFFNNNHSNYSFISGMSKRRYNKTQVGAYCKVDGWIGSYAVQLKTSIYKKGSYSNSNKL